MTEGARTPEFIALCEQVKQNTSPNDLLVFWNPRVLALLTERRSTIYALGPAEKVWDNLRRMGASYLVLTSLPETDEANFAVAIQQHKAELTQVYANATFTLYRLNPAQ